MQSVTENQSLSTELMATWKREWVKTADFRKIIVVTTPRPILGPNGLLVQWVPGLEQPEHLGRSRKLMGESK
jgi:hypothetical protein